MPRSVLKVNIYNQQKRPMQRIGQLQQNPPSYKVPSTYPYHITLEYPAHFHTEVYYRVQ
jgi:hypothetical protein